MNKCMNCGVSCLHNYCSWDCQVEEAEKLGGPLICPNGLPISCLRGHDNARMENAYADHPTYKFPVSAEFRPPSPGDYSEDYHRNETHALIYVDRGIALTIYDACYAMWYLHDGRNAGGRLWMHHPHWALTEESLKKIKQLPECLERKT